jgi:hypothetical protein
LKHLLLTSSLLFGITSLSMAQTYSSPNQLGSGKLPGTYDSLVFTLYDGNWTPQISLPALAKDKASVKIVSKATWGTQVLQAHSDVPLPALSLATGQTLEYKYSAVAKRWEIVAPTAWAPNTGGTFSLSSNTERVQRAAMRDGAWAPALNLPTTAVDGALLLVNSRAAWSSRIDPSQVLHASTMPLRSKDEYAFVFNARLGKWVLNKGPETSQPLSALRNGQLPVPTTAMTRLSLPAGSAATTLRLPARAGDRDRVVISSNANARSTIANSNVKGVGTMTVGLNQSYEFMWNAEAATWVPLKMPRTLINTATLKSTMLPPVQTPVTEVVALGNDQADKQVQLSKQAQVGDRVLVRSAMPGGLQVAYAQGNVSNIYKVTKDEEVAFVKTADGWSQETETIRILLTFGQGVTAKYGAQAAASRQLESLRLTNEALENSGARFRFQAAGLLEVPNLGSTLGDALNLGRTNVGIQTERQRLLADAVYYEGTESGCGLAFVNSTPSDFNMLASGSTACGTTVMRHELGHNMGLGHGNGVVPTVMSGNSVSSFATPSRFDSGLGVHLGHGANVPDEVTPMNKNATPVARFR